MADYAERLAAKALGLELMTRSTTGFDAKDSKGVRFEVKSRRPTLENRSTKVSFLRGLNEDHFDFLVGILFEEDFSVRRACLMPIRVVREVATFRDYVNAWDFHLRDAVWEIPGVEDITEKVRVAAAEKKPPW